MTAAMQMSPNVHRQQLQNSIFYQNLPATFKLSIYTYTQTISIWQIFITYPARGPKSKLP